MIELHELTKRYGDKTAVDRLTFTVRPGTVTGFLGPNGSGKTTTMRMMLDLDSPTSGSVRIDGQRYSDIQEPMKHVGALLDAKALHPSRTAYHHLLWLAQSNRIPKRRVDEVLEIVGISDVARQRAGVFSLGMGQRLGIAAALLGDPQILVLDEPINGLDPEGILWIRTLMKDLAAGGRTVFVSSHLMSEMAQTADHLVVIGRGRLLADTPTADFIQQNSHSVVRLRTTEPERLRDAFAAAGITPTVTEDGAFEILDGDPATLGALAASHQIPLLEIGSQNASLEEAFMRLTAGSVEYHATPVPSGTTGPEQSAPADTASTSTTKES